MNQFSLTVNKITNEMRHAKRNMKNIGRLMLGKQPVSYTPDSAHLNLIQKATRGIIEHIEHMGNRTQKTLSKVNNFQKSSVKHDLKLLDNKKPAFKKPVKDISR